MVSHSDFGRDAGIRAGLHAIVTAAANRTGQARAGFDLVIVAPDFGIELLPVGVLAIAPVFCAVDTELDAVAHKAARAILGRGRAVGINRNRVDIILVSRLEAFEVHQSQIMCAEGRDGFEVLGTHHCAETAPRAHTFIGTVVKDARQSHQVLTGRANTNRVERLARPDHRAAERASARSTGRAACWHRAVRLCRCE